MLKKRARRRRARCSIPDDHSAQILVTKHRVELARVLRGLGPLGREVVFLSVLPDRWVRHSEGLLHLRRRIAIREHVAYPLYPGHVQHLPFLPLDSWVGP